MSTTAGSIERNIEFSFEFAKAIFDDPTILEEVPEGSTLVLLPDDDPSLAKEKMELGIRALHRGENVYFRHVKRSQITP